MRNGFSLVELSIVLVILGLLTGGILGGQSLIHAAELRSIPADVERYTTAANTFRDKYLALPGDMNNAVRFWGAQAGGTADGIDATCAALGMSNPATGKPTCNGDGDGRISGTSWSEVWRFWHHLSNAGLIEGTYTGVSAHASLSNFGVAGENMPASKASGGGFVVAYQGGSGYFQQTESNTFRFGAGEAVDEPPGMIKAEDAWTIDMKIDDGKPGTGIVRTYNSTIRGECVDSDNGATAAYLLQNSNRGCNLFITAGF